MRARCILGFVIAVGVGSNALALELVRGGKGVARIVVTADAPRAERFAASEFQSIVAAMSGAKLPIASDLSGKADAWVLIGEGAARLAGRDVMAAVNADEIRDDGYALATVETGKHPALVVLSKTPRGTLFAVYNLLETAFSCGFFSDGSNLPKQRDLALYGLSILGNPAFPLRACYVPTRYYAPKQFQATLWNVEEWKQFLRWMARKKMNCLAVEFSGDTRGWGEAFDRAFPEIKQLKRETIPPSDQPPVPGPTVNMGWGLHPSYTTRVWKEVFAYARETLGIQVLYILHVGEFELPLKLAQPNLKWLPAAPRDFVGVAGESPTLSPTDPKFAELQRRLWQSIVATYGTDHLYAIDCHSHRPIAGSLRGASNSVLLASKTLRDIDKKARIIASSADTPFWGDTQEQQTDFLERLPEDTTILYVQKSFPGDALFRATERFGGHAFHYASSWAKPDSDLWEYCFDHLRTQSYHMGTTPTPKAAGYFHWAEIRGTNPLMDSLGPTYAWTGRNTWRSEGGSNNPQTRLHLSRRFSRSAWWQFAEAFKMALRGAPRGDTAFNYRAYTRWAGVSAGNTQSARASVALLLSNSSLLPDNPFVEGSLVAVARNYLHLYLADRHSDVVALVRSAKDDAKANAYNADAKAGHLAQLKELESSIRSAHTTLTRLLATSRRLCLDDAILEAAATPGANKNLAAAIREHQSGAFFDGNCLVDSIEYHQQLKKPQIDAFLKYARTQLTSPTSKPVPDWQEFFLHGTRDFIYKAKPVPFDRKAEKAKPSAILAEFLKLVD